MWWLRCRDDCRAEEIREFVAQASKALVSLPHDEFAKKNVQLLGLTAIDTAGIAVATAALARISVTWRDRLRE